jgi:hypothetical protein
MPAPVITAGGLTLGTQPGFQSFMPYPWGQGDITWQGAQFGFANATSGAQVQRIQFRLKHRISSTAAFSSAQAQVYDGGTPVGSPFTLTQSVNYVTDTFSLYSGYPATDLSSLALQVTWHSTAPGLAYVNSVYAQASYSYPNAITPFSFAGRTTFGTPAVTVNRIPAGLVQYGPQSFTLNTSFTQPTQIGHLLVAWVYSNSGSSTFDTTCSTPGWTQAGHAGAAFGWTSMWYKTGSVQNDPAPSFSSPATAPQSQVAEFICWNAALDQAGTLAGTGNPTVTASAPDTHSYDLIVTIFAWLGTVPGPTTISVTGADSSGTGLGFGLSSNPGTTGSQFYGFAWAQASAPAGPGEDAITGTLGVFAGVQAITASFSGTTGPPLNEVFVTQPLGSQNRAVSIPAKAGGFRR